MLILHITHFYCARSKRLQQIWLLIWPYISALTCTFCMYLRVSLIPKVKYGQSQHSNEENYALKWHRWSKRWRTSLLVTPWGKDCRTLSSKFFMAISGCYIVWLFSHKGRKVNCATTIDFWFAMVMRVSKWVRYMMESQAGQLQFYESNHKTVACVPEQNEERNN